MINVVIDSTMLNTFMDCPLKFQRRFVLNKTTDLKPMALDRGGVIHIGEEAYWLELKNSHNWESAVQKMLVAIRLALSESDLDTELGTRILEVMEENKNRWRLVDLSYQIIAVEQAFSYVLYEDETHRIIIIGKIDLLFSDNVYNNTPMDHKSYDRDYPVSRFNNQFINYAYAMESNYLFVNRIGLAESIGVGSKRTKDPAARHRRVPLSFDPLLFSWWKTNTIKWAFQYLECATNNDWPANLTSCNKYGRDCEYLVICDTSGEENKEYKLNVFFKDSPPWDVSKVLTGRIKGDN